jgi:hypothetical protein
VDIAAEETNNPRRNQIRKTIMTTAKAQWSHKTNVKLKNLRKQETTLTSFGTHNYELESLMSMLFAAVFAL